MLRQELPQISFRVSVPQFSSLTYLDDNSFHIFFKTPIRKTYQTQIQLPLCLAYSVNVSYAPSLISDGMLMAASNALADSSPFASTGRGELLPPLSNIADLSKKIAFAVGKVAITEGLALEISDEQLEQSIDASFWKEEYRPYKRVSI